VIEVVVVVLFRGSDGSGSSRSSSGPAEEVGSGSTW